MRIADNDCVGCETCINCGRGDYIYWECDFCNEPIWSSDDLFNINGHDACRDCYVKWEDGEDE